MYITILGRQPQLGIAELERVYGSDAVRPLSPKAALINTDQPTLARLGGALKAGKVIIDSFSGDWHSASQKIVQHFTHEWAAFDGKITLGLSAYGFDITSREVQKTGIILKQKLKQAGVSLRLIPNTEAALSTATSHHNKLGLAPNKVELLIIRGTGGKITIASSIGAQNITAYTKRDQQRPKRDAFVGMLPPKLAQIMINLAQPADNSRILDPFCGTGVVLQEATLMGYPTIGSDLVPKMIDFTRQNLEWLARTHHVNVDTTLHEGDAMTTRWPAPIDAVVAETYLGQPFSAPPSLPKLAEVSRNCDHIILEFLRNLAPQIKSGTPLCIAIPAWRDSFGAFTHLTLDGLGKLGYTPVIFKHVKTEDLLYYREDQIVARELLVLIKV